MSVGGKLQSSMYDWLDTALAEEQALILTANRRLSRELRHSYDQAQVSGGRKAWRTPPVFAWRDWLTVALSDAFGDEDLPVRINDSQSRILFEQSLRADLSDPFLRYASLARQCFDAWVRLHEWCVPLAEWQLSAAGLDQRVFARAADRYSEQVAERAWIDTAQLPGLVRDLIRQGRLAVPARIFLAGFDRLPPQLGNLLTAVREKGGEWSQPPQQETSTACLMCFDSPDAELRAAGQWARLALERDRTQRIGIVVGDLEQGAERAAALVREGFCPGWQSAPPAHAASVNLSYGRNLADFPAVSVALLALRWLSGSLRSRDLSILFRSSFLEGGDYAGRCRFELWLRDWPDREWSIPMLDGLLAGVRQSERFAGIPGFMQRFREAAAEMATAKRNAPASEWARRFDAALAHLGWPGAASLSSSDFQLINRWRKLLNEFARLELVLGQVNSSEALHRLAGMASDALFQPEQQGAVISVIGPLEAAGLEFDRLWLTGTTATAWPPRSKPLSLVSRDLQREYGMPDSTPADTAAFARDVIQRLRRSCDEFIASYPAMIGDAEQLPSRLLDDLPEVAAEPDPGWHADSLRKTAQVAPAEDTVPAVFEGERVTGGASTIGRQKSDPFSAFAYGRLGIRWLVPFTTGIAANVRGNLVHASLQTLLRDRPSSDEIRAWDEAVVKRRIAAALNAAFARQEAQADEVLKQMLAVERERTTRLLREVLRYDREERPAFAIAAVESSHLATFGHLRLELRCDRIDQIESEALVILDYKTGARKALVGRDGIRDLQPIVYACAIDQDIAGLGFYNVNSKDVSISGAGPALGDGADWPERLNRWKGEVFRLAEEIAGGDVRLSVFQKIEDARPLTLLSRFPEVQRES